MFEVRTTPDWIRERMKDKGISGQEISELTGIDPGNISNWVNGKRPMSRPVKAMFWFMLKD